jgi:aspartate carbamoyltransferase catalytic subunit
MAQRPTGVKNSDASSSPVRFRKKHLLAIADLDRFDAENLLDRAERFAPLAEQKIKKLDTLRGRTLINLFFEPSTRTQASFELAGKRLGADVMNMSVATSSVTKGETLIDTAVTLNAMRPDVIVVRHHHSGAVHLLARKVTARSSTPATAATSIPRRRCSTRSPSAATRAASTGSPSRSAATSCIRASRAPTSSC